jgi:AraC family transcriptional regulator, transcriptional activator of pobA
MHSDVNTQTVAPIQVVHLRQHNNAKMGKLPPRKASNVLCIYPLNGTILVQTKADRIVCKPDAVWMVDEENLIDISLTEEAEGFAVIVSKPLFLEICATENLVFELGKKDKLVSASMLKVHELFQPEVKELVYKLAQMATITFSSIGIQRHLLRIFLIYISYDKSFFSNCRDQELTRRFIQLVDQATVKKTIEEYASELQISRNYLSRTFKKCSGQSPVRYIQQRFIHTAKQLACQTPLSMKEVGYRLGFDDPAHFSKFFKMNTGLNFTEYKKQVLARTEINK